MTTLDNKLKTSSFWLSLGAINHCIALVIIAAGCVYSGFTCQGEPMKEVLSIYTFTIFTPQIALEVILLMALFLVTSSLQDLHKSRLSLVMFISTFALLTLFAYWQL